MTKKDNKVYKLTLRKSTAEPLQVSDQNKPIYAISAKWEAKHDLKGYEEFLKSNVEENKENQTQSNKKKAKPKLRLHNKSEF
jgi:hypothetical protein